MELKQRTTAFIALGNKLESFLAQKEEDFMRAIRQAFFHNGWFTEAQVLHMLRQIRISLQKDNLEKWISNYDITPHPVKKVGIIMAGNIPLVGFHDCLCVLVSGNIAVIKLSSDDKILLPFVLNELIAIEPEFKELIRFSERISDVDAVIATGSDNSARYFDYYFGKYPNIIRKNRNSVAVLDGMESYEDLVKLGEDIFRYFGLGCRNVSKLYVPENYNLELFFKAMYEYQEVIDNKKYGNNYDYHRAILMMKQIKFLENGFLIVKEDPAMATPVSILNYEFYNSLDTLKSRLNEEKEHIQCIVARPALIENSIPFGNTQCPSLSDYADGVDTMKFLLTLGPVS